MSVIDELPPTVQSTVKWGLGQFAKAGGRGTPWEQMVASVIIAVAMVVSSFGALTWLAPIMLIPFLIGAARYVWGSVGGGLPSSLATGGRLKRIRRGD